MLALFQMLFIDGWSLILYNAVDARGVDLQPEPSKQRCGVGLLAKRAQGGQLIRNHRVIASSYPRGWCLLDVISVMPFDTVMLANPNLFGGSDGKLKLWGVMLQRGVMSAERATTIASEPRAPVQGVVLSAIAGLVSGLVDDQGILPAIVPKLEGSASGSWRVLDCGGRRQSA